MKIKMVADTNCPSTKRYLKKLWEGLSEKKRLKVLNEMGHSDKWVDSDFNDLTGDIQSRLITNTIIVSNIV